MDAPEQLALDLPAPPIRREAGVILAESNRDAATFAARPELWPGPMACLVGEPGCGKTFLGEAGFSGATRLQGAALLVDAPASSLSPFGAAGRFWFDDLDLAHDAARALPGEGERLEQALFHLLNELAVSGGRLLASGATSPALWPVALPDLRTRLNAALVLRIEPPEDGLLEAFVERRLQERGLRAGAGLPRYLLQRLERSFGALEDAVERLDRAGLKQQRPVTRDLAARVLDL